jgi:hypothetical protein
MPTNPMSPSQTTVRARFATNSQAWRALTAAQRAAWTSLGANMNRTDSLGQTYTLTGQQAFVSVNTNLLTIGQAAVSAAPAFSPPAPIASITITATAA